MLMYVRLEYLPNAGSYQSELLTGVPKLILQRPPLFHSSFEAELTSLQGVGVRKFDILGVTWPPVDRSKITISN